MKIKEGSRIHLTGRLDTEECADKETGELKSQWVIIVDDIEYGYSGGGKEKDSSDDGFQNPNGEMQQPVQPGMDPAAMQGYQVSAMQMPQIPPNGQQGVLPPQAAATQTQYAVQPPMTAQVPGQMPGQAAAMPGNFTGFEPYDGQQFL